MRRNTDGNDLNAIIWRERPLPVLEAIAKANLGRIRDMDSTLIPTMPAT